MPDMDLAHMERDVFICFCDNKDCNQMRARTDLGLLGTQCVTCLVGTMRPMWYNEEKRQFVTPVGR